MFKPISKFFTWNDALFLPSWNRQATTEDGLTDDIRVNLSLLFAKMDKVRDAFDKPIRVHVTYRPIKYNAEIGGAPSSAHTVGKACDFDVIGMDCDTARQFILDNKLLDTLEMRMERNEGKNWIHLDMYPVKDGGNRYFHP